MTTEIRNCANCACSLEKENSLNKMEKQLFCRRNVAQAVPFRAERPRILNGEVMIDKRTNKPQVESFQDVAYMHAPTAPELVCYDGWRPIGTLPGDKSISAVEKAVRELYQEIIDGNTPS